MAPGAGFGFVVALGEGPGVLRGVRGGCVGAVEAGGRGGEGVGGAAEEDYAFFLEERVRWERCWDGERRGRRVTRLLKACWLATTADGPRV